MQGRNVNLGADKDAALHKLNEILHGGAIIAGAQSPLAVAFQPAAPPEAPRTLESLSADYLNWYRATRKPRCHEVTASRLRQFLREFGKINPFMLTPGKVELWANSQGWSQTTRRTTLIAVKAFLAWLHREKLIPENPIAALKRPQAQSRQVILTTQETQALMDAARPDLRDVIRLLAKLGCRPHLLVEMTSAHVDWGARVATLVSKNQEYRLFLPRDEMPFLEELARRYPSGPLLRNARSKPHTVNGLGHRMVRLSKRTGIRAYLYAWRHTVITERLVRGDSPALVAELAGHKDLTMISTVYSKVSKRNDELREVVDFGNAG